MRGGGKPVIINKCGGKNYIHDGHHRLVLDYFLDHLVLEPNEYKLTYYSAKQYNEINYAEDWVTPYDIVNQVRLPNFAEFKDIALHLKSDNFIRQNWRMYAECRQLYDLYTLARKYDPELYYVKTPTTDSEQDLRLPVGDFYVMVRLRGSNFSLAGGCIYKGKVVTANIPHFNAKWYIQEIYDILSSLLNHGFEGIIPEQV
jgi:hypothetical protein